MVIDRTYHRRFTFPEGYTFRVDVTCDGSSWAVVFHEGNNPQERQISIGQLRPAVEVVLPLLSVCFQGAEPTFLASLASILSSDIIGILEGTADV